MNEMFQIEVFYQESMELKIRDLLSSAKRQLEYGFLHKDYRDVKGELINIVRLFHYIFSSFLPSS
jgi:hypothetical protein